MIKTMTTEEEATPEMEAITNLNSLIAALLEPCFMFFDRPSQLLSVLCVT